MNHARTRLGEVGPLIHRLFLALACATATLACSGRQPTESVANVSESRLTPQLRADYDVFTQRCSKCHSLAKPLNSNVDDDEVWVHYVAKMRRQPGSGISERDGEAILRFLHVLVEQQRAKNAEKSK